MCFIVAIVYRGQRRFCGVPGLQRGRGWGAWRLGGTRGSRQLRVVRSLEPFLGSRRRWQRRFHRLSNRVRSFPESGRVAGFPEPMIPLRGNALSSATTVAAMITTKALFSPCALSADDSVAVSSTVSPLPKCPFYPNLPSQPFSEPVLFFVLVGGLYPCFHSLCVLLHSAVSLPTSLSGRYFVASVLSAAAVVPLAALAKAGTR